MIKSTTFVNIIFLVATYFIYLTYSPFLVDIAIAVLLTVALFDIENFFYTKTNNKYFSSALVSLFLALLLFTPLVYFFFGVADLIHNITPEAIKDVLEKAKTLLGYLPDVLSSKLQTFLAGDNIQSIYNGVAKTLGSLTAKSAVFIKDMMLIIIFVFFANLYGKDMLRFLQNISPLEKTKGEKLFKDTREVMGLVFYSTIVTAIFEGLLFGIFVQFYGFDGLFFTVMYAFASLVPVIGGAIMWVPMSLYLYAKGDSGSALQIALYSVVVISIVADTFIKPWIIKIIKTKLGDNIKLNELLIFFSIVAGLSSFGFWGVVLGPAITSIFISILKFYNKV